MEEFEYSIQQRLDFIRKTASVIVHLNVNVCDI